MSVNWVANGFYDDALQGPFSIDKDEDYYDKLAEKFKLLYKCKW